MTAQEAAALGYEVVKASDYEVGLVKNSDGQSRGIRTWWCMDFDRELPSLNHPTVQKAIEINERHESHYL